MTRALATAARAFARSSALLAAWLVAWTLLCGSPSAYASGGSMSAAPAPTSSVNHSAPTPAPPWLDAVAHAGRVTVRSPKALHRLAARLAAAAESSLARIAGDLDGLTAPGPIEVRLVDDARELLGVAPAGRGVPPYAVGVAYPDLGVISIAQRRGAELQDAEATLRHELAHIALGAALGDDVPRWLHEGFAYQHAAEWSWERTETLAGMIWFHSIIPLEQLDRSFPTEEMATHRAYAEAYDFVGFLSRRGRWDDKADDGDRYPFRHFLADLASGQSMDGAAIRAFGHPIADLFDEWRSDIGNRLMFAPVGLFALSLWLAAAILLVLAWARRRRQARATLARWAEEDERRRRSYSGDLFYGEPSHGGDGEASDLGGPSFRGGAALGHPGSPPAPPQVVDDLTDDLDRELNREAERILGEQAQRDLDVRRGEPIPDRDLDDDPEPPGHLPGRRPRYWN
jgi:Peptidase MA superfamily